MYLSGSGKLCIRYHGLSLFETHAASDEAVGGDEGKQSDSATDSEEPRLSEVMETGPCASGETDPEMMIFKGCLTRWRDCMPWQRPLSMNVQFFAFRGLTKR